MTESGGLEAVNRPMLGMQDLPSTKQVIDDGASRAAMIELVGHANGTGVLVGPDVLLTACHVLGEQEPFDTGWITVVFDYVAEQGKSPAETGSRIRADRLLCRSAPNELDFALIKLAESVPADRGWYPLDPDEYALESAEILNVFHHPLGRFLTHSYAQRPHYNQDGSRILYLTNTLKGSSGSPLVDVRGKLVAMHHYWDERLNQGVPTSLIARAVLAAGFALHPAPEPQQPPKPGESAADDGPRDFAQHVRLTRLGCYDAAYDALLCAASHAHQAALSALREQLVRTQRFADVELLDAAAARADSHEQLAGLIRRLREGV